MVTNSEFNQIMKGEKDAKEVRPEAVDKAEKVDQTVETKPSPPTPDQSKDVPSPPPPPPAPPPPPVEQAQAPAPPTPPERPADPPPPEDVPLPPPAPQPPTVQPPPRPVVTPPEPDSVPMPPVREADATPPPPPKPPVPKPAPKPVPIPPPMPKPVPMPPKPDVPKVHEVHAPPKPHAPTKPKLDQLAKLMEEEPTDLTPTPKPSTNHAKAAAETNQESKFDPSDISRLLTRDAPSQRASSAHDTSRVASLGSPTAHAAKMSPSLWGALDGLLEEQYRQCWSYLGLNSGQKYIPQVRVVFAPNGSLESEPVLVNPPSDPALQSLADSAVRAVRRCNPLHIPDQYAPYFDQWRGRVLRFDPEDMAG
jgi:colicin import membrane protein